MTIGGGNSGGDKLSPTPFRQLNNNPAGAQP